MNTFAVFAELMRDLLGPGGRAGVIVPTGIATDDTTKHFFADLAGHRVLASLYVFENATRMGDNQAEETGDDAQQLIPTGKGHVAGGGGDRRQFAGVHTSFKFCLLTMSVRPVPEPQFVFFCHRTTDLAICGKVFMLSSDDIALLNPNTRTCPVFRTQRDAEITKAIYRRVPVLLREGDPDGNPWGIRFSTMFHMSNDSGLFRRREELEAEGYALEGNIFARV